MDLPAGRDASSTTINDQIKPPPNAKTHRRKRPFGAGIFDQNPLPVSKLVGQGERGYLTCFQSSGTPGLERRLCEPERDWLYPGQYPGAVPGCPGRCAGRWWCYQGHHRSRTRSRRTERRHVCAWSLPMHRGDPTGGTCGGGHGRRWRSPALFPLSSSEADRTAMGSAATEIERSGTLSRGNLGVSARRLLERPAPIRTPICD